MSEKKVVISCDSSADIPPEIIKQRSIRVIPLTINMGDKSYKDGEVCPDDLYEYNKSTGLLAKTSAPNAAEVAAIFEELTADKSAVVHFSISDSMSVSRANAAVAAADFEDVYVVDSQNLSSGISLLVLAACDMADSGMSAGEIAENCKELAAKVDTSFVLSRLDYLHKGGRCSGVAVFGANMLGIKPCIQVRNGAMEVGKKYRGRFSDVVANYISDKLSDTDDIVPDRIFVTHSGCEEAEMLKVCEQIKQLNLFKEILLCRAGCTISSHCGPGCMGILFIRKTPVK